MYPTKTLFLLSTLVLSACTAVDDPDAQASSSAQVTRSVANSSLPVISVSVSSSSLPVSSSSVSVSSNSVSVSSNSVSVSSSSVSSVVIASSVKSSSSSVAPAPQVEWKPCSNEKETCRFEGQSQVRYGAGELWAVQTATGSIECTNGVFGDPAPRTRKACEVPTTTKLVTVASSAASSSSAAPKPPSAPSADKVPAGFSKWSDGQTWGGNVPAKNAKVTIKTNQKVYLDQDITLNRLQIDGELVCANKDLNITAETIMVHGKMTCGTANKPYTHKLNIMLTGKKPANISQDGNGMGTKVIGVMMGGKLELHGEERTSWLNLGETAKAGSDQIVLDETTNWRVGDKLVITSTSQNYKEAEEVIIKAINGKVITLRSPLKYRHFGEKQIFSNDSQTWTANTRAEVGLLSRNIKVFGDEGSTAEKYGGHMMVMYNSSAYLSGIEMFRVGHFAVKGRYPFHWHLTGDVEGQYIKNSAIYNSWNRCVTVHGSHNALIEDNVCYKHVGHGFFLEDGIEQGNVFNRNLGLWTTRPKEADALIKSDFEKGLASQGPATYWISNGNNTFTNNVAAGSDGLGFWYDTEDKVTGPSASLPEAKNYSPRKSKFGKFKGNTAHSSSMALSICSRDSGRPGYEPAGGKGTLIEDLTVYYGGIGAIWPCNSWHRFKDIKVLDTGFGNVNSKRAAFVSAFPAFIDDSLFVSNSALAGNKPRARAAFGIYDFGTRVKNSHFVNYNKENAESSIFVEVGGGVTFMYQGMEGTTLENSDIMLKVNGRNSKSTTGNVIRDYDGTLSGKKGRWSLVPNNDLMKDSSCTKRAKEDDGVFCPYYYGQFSITIGVNNLPTVTVSRTDIPSINKKYLPNKARKFYKVFPPLNQSDYHHVLDFKDAFTKTLKSRSKVTVTLHYGLNGDTSMLALKNVKSNARVSKSGWTKVASVDALRKHAGRAWYKAGDTIHLKFKASGNSKMVGAADSVDVLF